MKTIEYRFVDKSQWNVRGAFDDEPDKKQWRDEATGLPCLIVRGPSGALCGYVGVSQAHALYEKHYDAIDVAVHGGLTFSDHCQTGEHGVCHVVEDGEDDAIWWFGFDCAHVWDLTPAFVRAGALPHCDAYRDFTYVQNEVCGLAEQIYALSNG